VVEDEYNPLVRALAALRVPVVVGINGACAGAGLGIALAGDLRVAAAGAKFATAFTGIGLGSDSALAWRLVHVVGATRAAELLLLAEPFPAEAALQWGLVNRVVEAEGVLEEARGLAVRLASGPTAAYAAVKQVLATSARPCSRSSSGGRRTTPRRSKRSSPSVPRASPAAEGLCARLLISSPDVRLPPGPLRSGGRASGAPVGQRVSAAQIGQTSRAATGHRCSVSTRASEPHSVSSQAPSSSDVGRCISTACHSAAVGP
jgi:hypothetical protein